MKFDNLLNEYFYGFYDIREGLAGDGVGVKQNKINRMAMLQSHADFRIALGAADARAVTGARINDYNRPFRFFQAVLDSLAAFSVVGCCIRSAAVGNSDQGIVGGMLEILGIEDHLIVKRQHRRLAAANVFDVIVASFAENIRKNDGSL